MNRRQFVVRAASVLTSAVFLPDAVSDSVQVNLGGGSFSLRGWSMAVECGGKIVSERVDVPDNFIRVKDDYTFDLNFDHPVAAKVHESRSGSVWMVFYHKNWHGGREWVFRLPIEQQFIVNGDTATAST